MYNVVYAVCAADCELTEKELVDIHSLHVELLFSRKKATDLPHLDCFESCVTCSRTKCYLKFVAGQKRLGLDLRAAAFSSQCSMLSLESLQLDHLGREVNWRFVEFASTKVDRRLQC